MFSKCIQFLVFLSLTVCGQIFRCHAVWNNSKRVIIIPCFLLLAGSGNLSSKHSIIIKLMPKPLACGYTYIGITDEEYDFRQLMVTFLFTTVALNLLVTVLMGAFSPCCLPTWFSFQAHDWVSSWPHLVDSAEGPIHFRASTDFQVQDYDCNYVCDWIPFRISFLIPRPFQQSGVRHYLLDICRIVCGFSWCV